MLVSSFLYLEQSRRNCWLKKKSNKNKPTKNEQCYTYVLYCLPQDFFFKGILEVYTQKMISFFSKIRFRSLCDGRNKSDPTGKKSYEIIPCYWSSEVSPGWLNDPSCPRTMKGKVLLVSRGTCEMPERKTKISLHLMYTVVHSAEQCGKVWKNWG